MATNCDWVMGTKPKGVGMEKAGEEGVAGTREMRCEKASKGQRGELGIGEMGT